MSNSKTFRLFISSTFSDFKKEREVLQSEVFPVIKEYASKQGYTFQPIDLRWGVSNEAQLDQKTLELCLDEVQSCKNYPYPNFLVMLGDRYGWVPLPYAIPEGEFTILKKCIEKNNTTLSIEYEKHKVYDDPNDIEKFRYEKKEPRTIRKIELLEQWYALDKNQIPHSYVLLQRDVESEYSIYENWVAEENTLRKILQDTVENSEINKDENKRSKYFTSATESEIVEGIVSYKNETKSQNNLPEEIKSIDSQHVFGFLRNIASGGSCSDDFVGSCVTQARELKENVRETIIEVNILEKDVEQIDKVTLNKSYLKIEILKEDEETLETFLERVEKNYGETFEYRIVKFLKTKIDEQKKLEEEQNLTPLQIEKEAQKYFAQQKRKSFCKTTQIKELRQKICNYLTDSSIHTPMIIHGSSGSGKSALMAHIIKISERVIQPQSRVIYRFIGATPNSSSTKEVLLIMP